MITHYDHIMLPTVSRQGVREFYVNRLGFEIDHETDEEISLRAGSHCRLTFKEAFEAISPVHIAFEVPYGLLDSIVGQADQKAVPFLHGMDGNVIEDFGTGKNAYFRDGDGHLLEIIAHPSNEGESAATGSWMPVLYVREVGFPVPSVADFREKLVQLLEFRLEQASEQFTFAIGGTAHAVVVSDQRRWFPIDMIALPHRASVSLAAERPSDWAAIRSRLTAAGIPFQDVEEQGGSFELEGYRFHIAPKPAG
ncbi:glyoxalase/bleomycin resistance/dioxygenase family protein [Paenibacillus albicereus]|uniref:Glyoxalase/bleomycin resistance/dioxygenase family protein n=1 Tax=Paenibacillus albicereus TaxID=2726185 RepID=A0A6H2GVG1_9BACL|nr:glyoxalase/bleomycin resistance/dioxygenase family protein [Paenibacillus albicereus]QJC51414.1 glyoxalase/bleomycin resistance/dioxygenase family protein [Paenibacillus albicereus]